MVNNKMENIVLPATKMAERTNKLLEIRINNLLKRINSILLSTTSMYKITTQIQQEDEGCIDYVIKRLRELGYDVKYICGSFSSDGEYISGKLTIDWSKAGQEILVKEK